MQFFSNDQRVRSNTVHYLKEFNNQSLSTQAKKGKQLVFMMPAIKKAFKILGDDILELSTDTDALKNKKGDYDEKWLQESKDRPLKQSDDIRESNFIQVQDGKTDRKTIIKWLIYLIINCGYQSSTTSFPKKYKVQDLKINHLKLEVHDTYGKTDVINKGFLEEKLVKKWSLIIIGIRLQRV